MNEQQLAAVKQALEALMVFRYAPPAQRPLVLKAIADLEQAIAQDALDKKADNARELGLSYDDAPAPVQEPVSGVVMRDGCPTLIQDKHIKENDQRLYTTPPAAQPAQKPWVGLTDEDFIDLCEEASNFGTGGLIRHIEAKLKEKNT